MPTTRLHLDRAGGRIPRRFAFPSLDPVFAGSDGGAFYFVTPGVGVGGGSLLWKSDGTPSGTVELAHRPGILRPLVRAGGELFFVAAGRSFGPELWRTDGSPPGTRPVFDDGGPRHPAQLASLGGALYLVADAEQRDEQAGRAVWRFDTGAHQLTELGRFAVIGGAGWSFAATAQRLFFAAAETPLSGDALWVTDGTAAGTTRLGDLRPAGSELTTDPMLPAPAALGDELLFTAVDRIHGTEPWVTDGTPAGTRLLRDLVPGPQGSFAAGWVAADGRAFFAAGDGVRAAGPTSTTLALLPARRAPSTSASTDAGRPSWRSPVAATTSWQRQPPSRRATPRRRSLTRSRAST